MAEARPDIWFDPQVATPAVRTLTPVPPYVREYIHFKGREVFNSGLLCYTMQSEETKADDSASDSHTPRMNNPKLCRLKSKFGNRSPVLPPGRIVLSSERRR